LVTSFEVEVQLTFIENKWASNEQPSLNEMPEKNIPKKAIGQIFLSLQRGNQRKGRLTDPFKLLYSGFPCVLEFESVSENTNCEIVETGKEE
jgi:hypothetical protein